MAEKKAEKAPSKKTTVTTVKTTKNPKTDYAKIALAEAIGTFILTMVVVLSGVFATIYAGIALAVIVMMIGAVSGAHVNPAVSFGMWVIQRINLAKLGVYWVAQLFGATVALLLTGTLQGQFNTSFAHFWELSTTVLTIEAIATAIFVFGIVTVTSRKDLSGGSVALGVGASLAVAVMIATASFTALNQSEAVQTNAQKAMSDEKQTLPREVRAGGATLNPAVAIAVGETSRAQLQSGQFGGAPAKEDIKHSRLTIESILGTFLGAAIGALSAVYLIGGRRK